MSQSNKIIVVHNAETGERIEREMNAEELDFYETQQTNGLIQETAAAAKATAKAALLAQLGITAEQAKLLLS